MVVMIIANKTELNEHGERKKNILNKNKNNNQGWDKSKWDWIENEQEQEKKAFTHQSILV